MSGVVQNPTGGLVVLAHTIRRQLVYGFQKYPGKSRHDDLCLGETLVKHGTNHTTTNSTGRTNHLNSISFTSFRYKVGGEG